MECVKCKATNPSDSKYCIECGISLTGVDVCKKCNTENTQGSKFCKKCGVSLSAATGSMNIAGRIGKEISPNLFTLTFWPGILLLVAGILMSANRRTPSDVSVIAFIIGASALLFASIYSLVSLYRCWAVLQGSGARTTPGKAVGFLFIPFFNLYWYFVAIKGLANDANNFLKENNVESNRISEGLSLTLCILFIVNVIPVIGLFSAIASSIILTVLIYKWARFNNFVVNNASSLAFKGEFKPSKGMPALAIAGIIVGIGIMVLGILAAIAIPGYLGYQKQARVRAVNENFDAAYRLSRAELTKCNFDKERVTSDVISDLQDVGRGRKSPWKETAEAFATSISSPGQISISHTDLKSVCGLDMVVKIAGDADGDGTPDLNMEINPSEM